MAGIASRFEDLERKLDIGFRNVNDTIDNKVYSVRQDIMDSIMGFNIAGLDTLGNILDNVTRTIDVITRLPTKVMRELQGIFDKVMGIFKDLGRTIWGDVLFKALGIVSQGGVKDFLMQMANVGSVVLCGNLNMLTDLLEGHHLDVNIAEGLMFNLGAEWLNRQCKNVSRRTQSNMTLKEVMELTYPYTGTPVKINSVASDFGSLLGANIRYANNINTGGKGAKSKSWFASNAHKTRNVLYDEVAPFSNRRAYLTTLDNLNEVIAEIESTDQFGSTKHHNLLNLKGALMLNVPIAKEVKDSYRNLPLSQDAFGSYIRNLDEIDVSRIPTHQLNDVELTIVGLLPEVTKYSNDNRRIRLGHKSGDWQTGALDDINALFDTTVKEYVLTLPELPYSSRFNGLHPTTEEFIRDGTHYTRPRPEGSLA